MSGILSQIAPFFTGGVFGAAVLWGIQEYVRSHRDKTARERAASYLAMRLAVLFEAYALECANRIEEVGIHRSSGVRGIQLPKAIVLPDSTYWEYLRHDLAERALTFSNVAQHAAGAIEFVSSLENDPDATAVAFADQAGMVGMRAWTLACDLRSAYQVRPFRKEDLGWDFVDTLARAKRAAQERRVAGNAAVEA